MTISTVTTLIASRTKKLESSHCLLEYT